MGKLKHNLCKVIEVLAIGISFVALKDYSERRYESRQNDLGLVYSRYETSSDNAAIQFERVRKIEEGKFLAEYSNEAYLYNFDEKNAQMSVERLRLKEKRMPVSRSDNGLLAKSSNSYLEQ
ncbi:hypothetical protein HOE04_05290 [archaeon]|jgi:hypothetical protein|nr:hypothetical protein [archaeon]